MVATVVVVAKVVVVGDGIISQFVQITWQFLNSSLKIVVLSPQSRSHVQLGLTVVVSNVVVVVVGVGAAVVGHEGPVHSSSQAALRSISGSLSNISLLQFISQLHPAVVVVVVTVVVVVGATVVGQAGPEQSS